MKYLFSTYILSSSNVIQTEYGPTRYSSYQCKSSLPRQERWRSFSLIFLENIQVECTDPLPAVRAISDSSTSFVRQGGRGSSAQSSSSEKSPQSLSPLHRSRLFMHLPAIKIRKDTVCLMPHFLILSEVIKCNLMLKGTLDVFLQNHILMAHLGSLSHLEI